MLLSGVGMAKKQKQKQQRSCYVAVSFTPVPSAGARRQIPYGNDHKWLIAYLSATETAR